MGLSICACVVGVVVLSVSMSGGGDVAEKSSGVLFVCEGCSGLVKFSVSCAGIACSFEGIGVASLSEAGFDSSLARLWPCDVGGVGSMTNSASASFSDSPSEVSCHSVSLPVSMSESWSDSASELCC